MHGPDPADPYPMRGQNRVGFLKPLVSHPQIKIGDYSYYDDPDGPERFVETCVGHLYPELGDRLVIGRFCAIASGVRFMMNGANHALTGLSTYPFNIFGNGWESGFDVATIQAGIRGDTVVGNDVWIGERATILPGVSIGDGAIVASFAVVSRDVEPYAVVAGNPAREMRRRFDPRTVERLLSVAWWNWPAEKITRNLDRIRGGDIEALEKAR
ncbi:CatB-related O-acetyltransferase [Aurantimonas endophytica]|uniref:Virginiamycin A acetyltransferase n=1 Tax=Aurantimonas endophytica TaxID=1522175 RepID=A0A7W6MPC4_9HYPH|nr:CatB-related O-acetyltransferase [Aurantimonas endophytica]MBB4002780.1 virginiamycin A acetyltransferase [Aurantimonas endophytica]MCO6403658.1 chloramphenicol acetyltransferase [Aurantimonas endophytica]